MASKGTHPKLSAALKDCRRAFWSVAVFSGVVNLLMLAGPLYMLQIYDRVLASRSLPTLVALSVFLVGAYAFQGMLDVVRSRVVVRSAGLLDQHLGMTVHGAVLRLAVDSRDAGTAHQPVRDLDQIRSFLTGNGPLAIVDLPWMPLFLVICFMLHPWLGFVSAAGAVALFAITMLTEQASRASVGTVARDAGLRSAMLESTRRNTDSVTAMGMAHALAERWSRVNHRYLAATSRSSDVVGSFGSISKVVRLLLQSAILGLGAYLVIRQELTAGAMIAASIMMGRALAPIETAIANWRPFVAARQSIKRLSQTLASIQSGVAVTALPAPKSRLDVESVTVAAPGSDAAIVQGVHFHLTAGEVLGIIGPSGAGKSSIVRNLVNIWRPARGVVRLDGAALDQWDPVAVGRHIGYVSQRIELFDGTIAENIARMQVEPDTQAMLAAARAAGAHEMILRLPAGYNTKIGESDTVLSGGQRQRIALARALYGDPFLVVLDEAYSNLDSDGVAALQQAVLGLKARGAIVVVIAHSPAALANCDKVLVLANGRQQAFGPRDEIIRKVVVPTQVPSPGGLTVVSNQAAGGTR